MSEQPHVTAMSTDSTWFPADEHIAVGAQPDGRGLEWLKTQGIDPVLDAARGLGSLKATPGHEPEQEIHWWATGAS